MTENEKLRVEEFAEAILHGDTLHRNWLLDAATAFNKGEPMPKQPTSGLLLTQAESDKFADYLERSAKSGRGIIEQFEKLGSLHEVMTKKLKIECMAEEIVAKNLRNSEKTSL